MTNRLPCLAAVALLSLAAPAVRAEGKKSDAHPLVHAVIFYLKADAPADTTDEIIKDCHEMLAKVPTVRLLKAGKPADAPGRAKKDYAVGLVILFDDVEGLKTYIDHPLHKEFVAKHLKHLDVTKLAGYDFSDAK
jgi:hypothetical protein